MASESLSDTAPPADPPSDSHVARRPDENPITSRPRLLLRLTAVAVAAIGTGTLLLAGLLTPNSAGLGTHHQLGLPPCSARVLLGIRCPSCGMTTSWSHFMRGQWLQSARANVGGFLLAFLSLHIIWLSIRVAVSGSSPSQETQRRVAIAMVAVGLVSLADWGIRLYLG